MYIMVHAVQLCIEQAARYGNNKDHVLFFVALFSACFLTPNLSKLCAQIYRQDQIMRPNI